MRALLLLGQVIGGAIVFTVGLLGVMAAITAAGMALGAIP